MATLDVIQIIITAGVFSGIGALTWPIRQIVQTLANIARKVDALQPDDPPDTSGTEDDHRSWCRR